MKKIYLFIFVLSLFLSCDNKEDIVDCNCVYKKEFKHTYYYNDGNIEYNEWEANGVESDANCDSEEIIFISEVGYPISDEINVFSEYRWKLYCN